MKTHPIAIEIRDLCFSHGETSLLNGVSLSLYQGEIVTLIGSSGTGKTTIFNLLTGFASPTRGEILILGNALPKGRNYLSYMMQDDLLLPWRNVRDNMLIFNELGRQTADVASIEARYQRLLADLNLKHCSAMYPHELSGGMRQRVALGRTLMQNRPILILDEPFASLDVSLRESMYKLLRALRDKDASTILMVTHDFHDAISLSDRVLLLKNQIIHKEWLITETTRNDPPQYGFIIKEMRESLKSSL